MTISNRRRRRLCASTASAAAMIVLLAACGSDSDDDDNDAAAPAPASSTASGPAAAAPTGTPFRVGFANMDKGTIPLPGLSDGAVSAAAYINANGGINGRPLELVPCAVDSNPDTNQACGQQFANDAEIDLAMMGISVGAGPYYAALAPKNIPVLGVSPVTPADFAAPSNVVFYYSGGAGTYPAFGKVVELTKAKTIAYLQLDNAGGKAGLDQFKEVTKDMGLTINAVPVSATATDVLPQLTQAKASSADLVIVGIPNCLPVAKALKAAGIKTAVTSVGSCFSAATIGSDPALFEGWYDPAYIASPLEGKGSSPEMDTFLDNYPKYAKLPTTPIANNAQDGWAGLLSLRDAVKGLSAADLNDKTKLLATLKAFKGPATLGQTTLDCSGNIPNYPSLCTLGSNIDQVKSGKLVKVA